jgi:hypothetical protein
MALERGADVVAVDTNERVVFGAHGHRDLPFRRAAVASSGFPPSFARCWVNGGTARG